MGKKQKLDVEESWKFRVYVSKNVVEPNASSQAGRNDYRAASFRALTDYVSARAHMREARF